jgi:hypothetical protein
VVARPSMTQLPTQCHRQNCCRATIGDTALIDLSASLYLVLPADVFVVIIVVAGHHSGQRHGKVCGGLLSSTSIVIAIDRPMWRRAYSPSNDEGPAFAGVPP